MRQSVFDGVSTGYGRTAALATSAVGRVTLLYHFLARFTVNTKPIGIIEEIIPLACDLNGSNPLDSKEIDALWHSKPEQLKRTKEEIVPHLQKAIEPSVYTPALQKRLQERLKAIKQERSELKKKFEDADEAWLGGIEDVSLASSDLLSVTVYYPAIPGGAGR